MVVVFGLLAAGQVHLLREVRQLRERIEMSSRGAEEANSAEAHVGDAGHRTARQPQGSLHAQNNAAAAAQRNATIAMQALEQRVNDLARVMEHPTGARAVAEYNVMSPPIGPQEMEPPVEQRAWGEEQIVGPPDTPTAADARTAWASQQADGGPEWLMAHFENTVDVAEVRIRETFNPGAISKVTGKVNGQEVVLWEGTATGGTAPRDFVVPVQGNLQANAVTVHLDTTRVAGWNEIDAVELVGKDGSRQWARSASASSSYADGRSSGRRQRQRPLEEALQLAR